MISTLPKAYVVVLNFKGWKDTLECLESVYRLDYDNMEVLCIDNGSANESLANILAWSKAQRLAVRLTDEAGQDLEVFPGDADKPRFTLMNSRQNLGYAGGNNLGLSLCLKDSSCEYAWILNNDVVVAPGDLKKMVETAGANHWGICGATLVEYENPTRIQAMAGRFIPFKGRNLEIRSKAELPSLTYVVGAAMLVSRQCLEKTLLPEEYFLYFEEADFCLTAKKAGIQMGVATEVSVRHKDGKSSTQDTKEYYYARNLLHFVRKHMAAFLLFALWYILVHRPVMKMAGGRSQALPYLLRGARDFFLGRTGKMPDLKS